MNKSTRPDKSCPMCHAEKVMRRLPKEVGRQLDYEDIVIPAQAEPQPRRHLTHHL